MEGSIGTTTTHEGDSQSPIHFLQRRVTILGIAGVVVLYQFQMLFGITLYIVRTNAFLNDLLDKLMLHIFIDEGRKHAIIRTIDTNHITILISIFTTGFGNLHLIVDIIKLQRLKIAHNLFYEVVVKFRAIANLYTLELTHLKERRFPIAAAGGFTIHLDTIFVSCGLIDVARLIAVATISLWSLENLSVGLGGIGGLLRIVDVVITGIVILLSLLHIGTLFLGIRFSRVFHTDTRNLLGHLVHADDLTWEVNGCLVGTEYIAGEIGSYMLLFIVIMELNAETTPKRVEHGLYRFIGEVVTIGIHQHQVSLQTFAGLSRFNGN